MEAANHKHSGESISGLRVPAIIGLGCISAAIYGFNFTLAAWLAELLEKTPIHAYVLMFMTLGMLYLAAVTIVVKYRAATGDSTRLVIGTIALAVLFRLFLIPQEPAVLSNDMYRFIWDGRVQHNGYNPYQHPPNAEELKSLRDDRIYPHINRKDARTLYPAGAQLYFRGIYAVVGNSVMGFKSAMIVFDIAALAVMVFLLRVHGFDPSRVLIYAWNPLVIFEIAYSGHLEGITVFFMVTAFYLAAVRKRKAGIIFLALASAIKLYPALLLPAFFNRGRTIKSVAVFSTAFVVLYLPYLAAGDKISGFLPIYLKNPYESFNLGVKYLLMRLFPSIGYDTWSLLLILTLVAAGVVVGFKEKSKGDRLYYGYILTGLLMVLMPAALHPWYVILVIPFLVFYTNPAWLIFSCAVTLSYLKYVSAQGIMPLWVLACEYIPLLVLLFCGFISQRLAARSANHASTAGHRDPEGVRS